MFIMLLDQHFPVEAPPLGVPWGAFFDQFQALKGAMLLRMVFVSAAELQPAPSASVSAHKHP